MTATATRRLQFCSGHRVLHHESKCQHPHGHNYVVELEAFGLDRALDELGRVVDFSVLKERIGTWIEREWDHGFLVFKDDSEMLYALNQVESVKIFVLPTNPTAENLAAFLLERANDELLDGTGVALSSVRVIETENCWAKVTR